MTSWQAFEAAAPELAQAGRRLLIGEDGGAIAFLATASRAGVPHVAPVCPIFCGEHLYLCAVEASVKVRDLRAGGGFALHAFLGEHDEEFQLQGHAGEVAAEDERAAVHAAIPFPSFEPSDPLFRLEPHTALHVHWENPGQADTRPRRARWRAHE